MYDALLVCDEAGLIGKEMFTVDGVNLPSNAGKDWSGTMADLRKKVKKLVRDSDRLPHMAVDKIEHYLAA